ncbi:pyridoxamine 5'-phosphate oxidase family protein [Pseudonocardia abyssalis]|uniref:Pyridoxamine 5'-phosphate oxidase family protein n=1 Tax=Pseudonocardia abyssalis TaxID=2792008 RepID=A0ABS6UL71_9PSEU|nr:pyridoxamine 5'-phosphate oxidase family protein [Pseudonocardia abyssalis]MBW0119259.1 pyridoxamine 5'-phosphate oxidase family protein [Pseudonocardia abyssalis]MBW0132658.1 pyridoxamine 5'-phosphate oxidase family protein [Pseudonocardia abyssalis]
MTPLSPTSRSTIRRGAARARTDRAELYAVLDAGTICHLGVVLGGAPVVLPTGYGRIGDVLYLHGSTGAGTLRAAADGAPICVTVTHVDGIVHARAVFHFSMNYRSAVAHGVPRLVTDADERLAGLRAITENIAPGAWDHARGPNRKELAATQVVALDLAEASVKVRTGPPVDDDEDVEAGLAWAGVVPLHTVIGTPEPCSLLPSAIGVPDHVTVAALVGRGGPPPTRVT